MRALAVDRRRALRARRARCARRAAVRVRRRAARRAARRSFAAARTTACRSSSRSRRRASSGRRSSSTSRTSRCSGRASGSGSRAACSRSGSRTSAPTSASTRRRSSRSPLPSLAVIGTGKRVGKTAVTGHVARLLARDREVVVVAMGRGGPPEPELVEAPPSLDELLELSRSAGTRPPTTSRRPRSPASPTVGCRRCGRRARGGAVRVERARGRALAASAEPDVVVFDGSGAAIPPVDVDARVLVAERAQPATSRRAT